MATKEEVGNIVKDEPDGCAKSEEDDQTPAVKRRKLESGDIDHGAEPGVHAMQNANDVLVLCEKLWSGMIATEHPMTTIRRELRNPEYRRVFCGIGMKNMMAVHPDMRSTLVQRINLNDASDPSVGSSGEAHLLMIGFEMVKDLGWSVLWKRDGSLGRLRNVWRQAIESGRGLDTTSRSIKVCVSRGMCEKEGKALFGEMLFAGYVSGSTLGTGSLLLLWMLIQIEQKYGTPWHVPQVMAFLRSIARIKCTFAVYTDTMQRATDAWRSLH